MPVWGVSRARRGPEVLRVTLYCSWDNYEDAVRLYETILREEAAAREGERCVFEVRAAARGAVRLCLARLPAGVPAEPHAAALLQFRV
ncbi:F124B protein, partial [Eudromia elegans]|nr:F124B protein [Eudromia elegans]